jgi:hypothetical protein
MKKITIVKKASRPRPPLACPWLIDFPSEGTQK